MILRHFHSHFFFATCDAMRWMIYEIEFVCGIFMLIPSDLFLLEIRCSMDNIDEKQLHFRNATKPPFCRFSTHSQYFYFDSRGIDLLQITTIWQPM